MMEMMSGMAIWMLLFWLLIAALLVLGIVFLVRALSRQTSPPHAPEPRAIDTLEERFAEGELDRDEFEARRRALET